MKIEIPKSLRVPKSVRRLFRTAAKGSTKGAAVSAEFGSRCSLARRAKLDPAFRRAHPEITPEPTKAQLRAEEKARPLAKLWEADQ
ncbi:MAG TPA: hypothetical protein VJP45_10360 [Candidatus Limnocylindria bacterium]|nr:hypothetical protein [Candidatus Limnocylindria bacterium]